MYFNSPHKSGDFLKFSFELGTTPAGFAGRPTLLSDQSCKDCKDSSKFLWFSAFVSCKTSRHQSCDLFHVWKWYPKMTPAATEFERNQLIHCWRQKISQVSTEGIYWFQQFVDVTFTPNYQLLYSPLFQRSGPSNAYYPPWRSGCHNVTDGRTGNSTTLLVAC